MGAAGRAGRQLSACNRVSRNGRRQSSAKQRLSRSAGYWTGHTDMGHAVADRSGTDRSDDPRSTARNPARGGTRPRLFFQQVHLTRSVKAGRWSAFVALMPLLYRDIRLISTFVSGWAIQMDPKAYAYD